MYPSPLPTAENYGRLRIMDPQTTWAKTLLSPSSCVVVPKYQRHYIWGPEQAHSLIRDIAEVATQPTPTDHWTGVVIYRHLDAMERCPIGVDDLNHTCREIIDGQQRLTTIRLWTKALIDHAAAHDHHLNYELTPFYLQKPNDQQFEAIENGEDVSRRTDPISSVYTYFRYILWLGEEALLHPDLIKSPGRQYRGATAEERWEKWVDTRESQEDGINRSRGVDCEGLLTNTIEHFSFLGLRLQNEDPERVFAALNGNRMELSQFDHLRNFCFAAIPPNRRDAVYNNSWEQAESEFETLQPRQGMGIDRLKGLFLYDFLISLGEGAHGRFSASRCFYSFQKFQRSTRFTKYNDVETWVEKYLPTEVVLWKAQRENFNEEHLPFGRRLELSPSSRRAMHRIRIASDGPPAPLVLWILRRSILQQGDPRRFAPEDVEHALIRLEGYLFKTLLAKQSLTNLRSAMIRSMGRIENECVDKTDRKAIDTLIDEIDSWTDVRWRELRPDLENAHRNNPNKGVYGDLGTRETLALLDVLDEELTGERATGFLPKPWEHGADPFWVEHIFPQKEKRWTHDLDDWAIDMSAIKSRLHVLGNLTALPSQINKAASNYKFSTKRETVEADRDATASKLNSWTTESSWLPDMIDTRTHELVATLQKRWPDPPTTNRTPVV
jgi:hypothetical protein